MKEEKVEELTGKELNIDKKEWQEQRKIPEFTLEQRVYLESFFNELCESYENVQSMLKVTNTSLMDSFGNPNINLLDIERILNTVDRIINPINMELFELLNNADYLLYEDNGKNKITFWDNVEKGYFRELNKIKKRKENSKELEKIKQPKSIYEERGVRTL